LKNIYIGTALLSRYIKKRFFLYFSLKSLFLKPSLSPGQIRLR